VRLASLVVVLGLGLGVTAVLAASLVGSLVALAVPIVRLEDKLRGPRASRRRCRDARSQPRCSRS
jgi:hypothetical protein